MQHAQNQFTPEQMIVAGRRAEAQGQAGHALQFYQYIAETYPTAPEAYEARDAIFRLTDPQHQGLPSQTSGSYSSGGLSGGGTGAGAPTGSLADVRPALDAAVGGPTHMPPSGRGRAKPARRRRREPAVEEEPARASDYRIGRFVAAMLSAMGWLMLVGGVLMIPIMMAALTVRTMPKGLRDAIAANLIASGAITFGAIFLGLFALFAAQTARAAFNTADAVQDLLAARERSDS